MANRFDDVAEVLPEFVRADEAWPGAEQEAREALAARGGSVGPVGSAWPDNPAVVARNVQQRGVGNVLRDLVTDNWVVHMLQSGLTLPRDVVSGKVPLRTEGGEFNPEVVQRTMDTAGLVAGGSIPSSYGAAKNALGNVVKPRLEPVQFNPFEAPRMLEDALPGTVIQAVANARKAGKIGPDLVSEDGYVYHATNLERAQEIAQQGLRRHKPHEYTDQQAWPDGSTERRSYFSPRAEIIWSFAPEEGQGVSLRVKANKNIRAERGTGDMYSTKDIDPSRIEILADDGKYYPISTFFSDDAAGTGVAAVGASQRAPVWYSAVEHAVENAKMNKASPEQWLNYIRNQPGVKPEELSWIGLGDEAAIPGPEWGKSVTKKEVQDWLNQNRVEVKEVTRGSEIENTPQFQEAVDSATADLVDAFVMGEGRHPDRLELEEIRQTGRDQVLEDPQNYGIEGQTPRYSDYQLPGGENYREVLFTLPEKEGASYRSSHWEEPNVLAHVRMNDRALPDGGRALHLEEVQSDWHQAGRKQGYRSKDTASSADLVRANADMATSEAELRAYLEDAGLSDAKAYDVAHDMATGEFMAQFNDAGAYSHPDVPEAVLMSPELEKLRDAAYQARRNREVMDARKLASIPNAPFKQTWPDLVLKRMLRQAADEGYDSISWTPGEQQAARYDLSKQINSINVHESGDGLRRIRLDANSGVAASVIVDKAGKVVEGYDLFRDARGKDLSDLVGKDVAEKVMAIDGKGVLEGADLKVGGEGMKAFYDKMLVDKMNALGKKYGAKVEWKELPGEYRVVPERKTFDAKTADGFAVYDVNNNWQRTFNTEKEALDFIKSKTTKVPVFRIPDKMREALISRGQPLFASGIPFPLQPIDYDPFKEQPK